MEIAIVTDEISGDPQTAIELGLAWGVRAYELRGFGTQRVPLLSPFQKRRIEELLEQYKVRIAAISPGLFKCPHPMSKREHFPLSIIDHTLYEKWRQPRDLVAFHRQELLPLSIEYAQAIGAEKIVAFSFERDDMVEKAVPDEVLAAIQEAAEQCARASLELVIEVEAGFWADTGANTAAIMRAIAHPALGVNWDPGNAIVAGDTPYPDGYNAVKDYVKHVHFKDVAFSDDGNYHYVLEGEVAWAEQVAALVEAGYAGIISVETHMEPKVSSAKAMTQRLQALLREAEFSGSQGARQV
jgi:sugar phosphate isomerase/epimerase